MKFFKRENKKATCNA